MPLPILSSKEKKEEGREGAYPGPRHPWATPGALEAPTSPACQLSPGDRNSSLLARAHGNPTLQVVELA